MKVEKPRGTRDFLPEEMEKRREVENILRRIAELHCYREIQTPTFEHLELFTRKSGEAIIEEMYVFEDKSGRKLALRPELTAPVTRMFVNECSFLPKPLRYYYFSNCFRYERPQKGRYREFWQFGIELIGSEKPEADAEVIHLAYKMLRSLNLDFELHIGDVGLLRHILSEVEEQDRIMRLIDKREFEKLRSLLNSETYEKIMQLRECEDISFAEEIIPDFDFSHLLKVSEILKSLNVDFRFNFTVARGLDYYTGIVFEVYAKEGLGAQNQICGGGSYRLSKLFGGEDIQATGFAIGFDRIVELYKHEVTRDVVVAVISLVDSVYGFKYAEMLRENGIKAYVDVMGRSLKKQLSYANDIGASYALIIGEDEIKQDKVSLKNLKTGKQELLEFREALEILKKKKDKIINKY